ncbi:MAG: tetratricopeptide repeat protein [Alphaproteobacteria bacterium]|nr:tetratricopeptide repeat protein [Alphaproteobacteria bacterium]
MNRISVISMNTRFLTTLLLLGGCATRGYTHYLIEPAPETNPAFEEEEGTQLRPFGFGSTTAMTVSWNDGDVITEVQIPMLTSGQRIVVEHSTSGTDVETLPATRLVPPPPTVADATLDEAYRQRGLRVNPEAPEISISRARAQMHSALVAGNYDLAFEWCELILARYPSHPETLRAKGSILLMLGEREQAIETWEAVEEIESDPAVRKQLEALQREQ